MIDTHIHSSFSPDSNSEPKEIINYAIKNNFDIITFTDHYDLEYYNDVNMKFNIDDYFKELTVLKDEYKSIINILIGIEVGIQSHISNEIKEIVSKYPFDYIIGSTHLIHGVDPYYGTLYNEDANKKDVYEDYFNIIINNLNSYSFYDSMGHLDYLKRYTKFLDNQIYYNEHSDLIDVILKHLIANQKAFEVNTSNFNLMPIDIDILKRYKELGGIYITLGSDSHAPNQLGRKFNYAFDLIKSAGFDFITYYENRLPRHIKL